MERPLAEDVEKMAEGLARLVAERRELRDLAWRLAILADRAQLVDDAVDPTKEEFDTAVNAVLAHYAPRKE